MKKLDIRRIKELYPEEYEILLERQKTLLDQLKISNGDDWDLRRRLKESVDEIIEFINKNKD